MKRQRRQVFASVTLVVAAGLCTPAAAQPTPQDHVAARRLVGLWSGVWRWIEPEHSNKRLGPAPLDAGSTVLIHHAVVGSSSSQSVVAERLRARRDRRE